ncbi:hypothetical protein AUJ65_00910 [Candidatus Micrarchaeota archaeon CG1_02_51_15]|nr:MAG: hypothetical protein AUJ65_00910 [Candidatus Micrarchaeota archaeon CG1_02_51_15]
MQLFGGLLKYACENCNTVFYGDDLAQCPRCSSKKISMLLEKKEAASDGTPYVKHEEGACFKCGGKDFEYIWRRREKVCKKCGEIMPARRNR